MDKGMDKWMDKGMIDGERRREGGRKDWIDRWREIDG